MNSSILLQLVQASLLSDTSYYIICVLLASAVLLGIHFMSKVKTARLGNQISATAVGLGIVLTLIHKNILTAWLLYPAMAAGIVLGLIIAKRVKMIQMPQLVALLNGIGGAASAIVASFALVSLYNSQDVFGRTSAILAVVIGTITLSGSLIAAGKLHKVLSQRPVIFPGHQAIAGSLLVILLLALISGGFYTFLSAPLLLTLTILFAAIFGIVFSVRVGGADMPITISLLNSLSGLAAAIAGFAVADILLIAIGGIVGASGLFLTQIMCRAMNRSLAAILLGKTALNGKEQATAPGENMTETSEEELEPVDPADVVKTSKKIIIVPGYGMALAQAQHLVKSLAEKLAAGGAEVKYAIHPVAGRMPGHMDVLLIEAGVPFEEVFEMDDINGEFKDADATIVIGANDVLNPAARNAEGTPIYGMPILNVDQCNNIIIFNYDLQPGYSGVENPIYNRKNNVWVLQGDAKATLTDFLAKL